MAESEPPSRTWTEQERLKAIENYDILDSPREEEFDDIVKMAAQACNVPISLISFVTSGRQWFKAAVGTDLAQTPLDSSICSHAILQKDLFVIPDTTKDSRTKANPLVAGDPHVRFYAGAVLASKEGLPLGTVCVLDYKPRNLTEQEANSLKALARLVMTQLELRRTLFQLRRALATKTRTEARLEFLGRLTQKLSVLSGPEEINRVATREVGQYLNVNRCSFFEPLPADDSKISVLSDWYSTGESSLKGTYDLSSFGPLKLWQTLQHTSVKISDVRTEPLTKKHQTGYSATNICSILMSPFSIAGKWVAGLGVTSHLPRIWTDDEQQMLEDVTARVWPLLEKARGEERLRAMTDNIGALAWMARVDGFIFWYNKRWLDFTGESLEAMEGDGWAKVHDPEHLPHVMESWKEAIASGQPWEDTFPLRARDGIFRWFLSRAFPIRDEEGKITLWFGTNTDITDQREAQNALKEANSLLGDKAAHLESLVQQRTHNLSETIEELEAFSYSISHDMRAPLRSMISFSEILKEEHAPQLNATGVSYLDRIINASRRMDLLIQDVLNYSRLSRDTVPMTSVDADALLRDIIATYPNLRSELVNITIKSRLPIVKGNAALLTQCFSNLLDNATKFASKGAKPEIQVWGETVDGRAKLFFKDNGIGIPELNQERIFDIFNRVGRDNDGTGIGLAIVRKAATKMGGNVGVKSAPGEGSLFWLDLVVD